MEMLLLINMTEDEFGHLHSSEDEYYYSKRNQGLVLDVNTELEFNVYQLFAHQSMLSKMKASLGRDVTISIKEDMASSMKHLQYLDLSDEAKLFMLDKMLQQSIKAFWMHPVTFEFGTGEVDFDDVPDMLNDDENPIYHECKNVVDFRPAWDTVMLPDVHTISIWTGCLGNDDARGGGPGELFWHEKKFTYEKKCENGATLFDLTECIYRMKGSKYDCWYELLQDIDNMTIENGVLKLEVDFDYGS